MVDAFKARILVAMVAGKVAIVSGSIYRFVYTVYYIVVISIISVLWTFIVTHDYALNVHI